MAQTRETSLNLSSPHSSPGGADSYKHDGTPDTRLTAFSPDESSTRSAKFVKPFNPDNSESEPLRFPVKQTSAHSESPDTEGSDPFMTLTSTKNGQKLSPTASSFQPVLDSSSTRVPIPALLPVGNLQPSGMRKGPPATLSTLSRDLGQSRYLVVTSHVQIVDSGEVDAYLKNLERLSFVFRGGRQVQGYHNSAYIRFTDIRDARMIHENISRGDAGAGWKVDYVQPQMCLALNISSPADAYNEGLVLLEAMVGPGNGHLAYHINATVYSLLQAEADIFAFVPQESSPQSPTLYILIEFCDLNKTIGIINRFNGFTANGIKLTMTLCNQNAGFSQPNGPGGFQPFMENPFLQDVSPYFQPFPMSKMNQPPNTLVSGPPRHPMPPSLSMNPVFYQNQLSSGAAYGLDAMPARYGNGVQAHNNPEGMRPLYHTSGQMDYAHVPGDSPGQRSHHSAHHDRRRQNAIRVSRSLYSNGAGHHNHVDVGRIREGTDVRTTIMLRNIPNKVDQPMLKRIVDESSWGKYDFMYLRIDFANDCNVGYAFINFVDPLDIIDFVNARGNQRWNCFKSDKVAEISYATIQGKDCLVQKFRNSSVMLEAEHYRPKLFYTSNGPMPELAGEEEPFPGPDNQSKMKRSCENAEHVGLFTPNAGQHFRDEQRRRRSQFDRGTRLAALEEYDYETTIQQRLYPSH